MATIYLNNLNPAGYDLLSDEENFLSDLSEDQMNLTYGGATPSPLFILAIGAAAFGYQVGRNDRE